METPAQAQTLHVGSQIGWLRLLAEVPAPPGARKRKHWQTLCTACGTQKVMRHDVLVGNSAQSCGCKRDELRSAAIVQQHDLTGTRVSQYLTVLELVGRDRSGNGIWRCHCSGCNTDVELVRNALVGNRPQQSCGCKKGELIAAAVTTHGGSAGRAMEVWYTTYRSMVDRCTNASHPSYERYGGRGIGVHPAWLGEGGAVAFRDYLAANLGERPEGASLDRIDNNRGYEPGNLRWATSEQQMSNREVNHRVTAFGVTLTTSQWARLICIGASGLGKRLARREAQLADPATAAAAPTVEALLATPSGKGAIPHPLTPAGLFDVPALLRAAGYAPAAATGAAAPRTVLASAAPAAASSPTPAAAQTAPAPAVSAINHLDVATDAAGVTKPLHVWAAESGVPVGTLRSRLSGGAGKAKKAPMTLQEAIAKGTGCMRVLTHAATGESRSLSGWAAHAGLSPGCLNRRLARGMSLEAALVAVDAAE